MLVATRRLGDLYCVGPAIVRDLELLGVRSIVQLARRDPRRLYEQLNRVTGRCHDVCVLDVFEAAVAEVRDPDLPAEQCCWWYWSRQRKARDAAG